MRIVLAGTAASRGMALGRARLVKPSKLNVDNRPLDDHEVEAEIERLHAAIDAARAELIELREKLHGALARDVGEFIDAHSLLLEDPELIRGLDDMIRKGHYRASAALKMQADRLGEVFEAMDDPYLRSRREDIDQVIGRVMSVLLRQTSPEERKLAARVGEILVADTIAPGDMAHLAGHGLLGIVAAGGSVYSHSAILARSLNLPMLVATSDALGTISDEDLVLIDAEAGEAVIHPTAQDLTRYRNWQREAAREGRRLAALAKEPTRTRDNVDIRLFANAEQAPDVAQARALGASGIGLYRTEFLFLRSKGLPSEDEQFHAYRDLVLGMGGLPCTIRTLDLGADKADNAGIALREEDNPALGVRGVRLSLRHPAVFASQLRAILRATSYGPIRILVPMITTPDELGAVRSLLHICARDLRDAGHTLPELPEVGAMIEVPAAAIGIHTLLDDADFFAIGTNDLAQYVLAADRNNDALGTLYDPLQPALLRLIARVIGVGRRAGKPVSLCGEMAGDPLLTPLLLALGLTDFSMHPTQMLEVRDRIGQLERARLRKLSPQLLRARSSQEVAALLDSFSPNLTRG
ncbi:phosphoenolpyruvate--protein phosphotransferase [Oleiagrimonas soli]|uniref:Phosphoenolpyruvate-protein phosphotransferase n=1 Tax=Oleiagrimonas soli TaxID=1543381 RepID=A0A099CTD5_9GAMM|nr:phosphoenolpyruvate--protein phosphotransferase [Oleiagrimonas soli]KGI77238.1 phosphoenolpyruvate-protein phosphotransferase [Oleiagrimonas soli]MBB6185575.1 phosphotransferase system enzyme I (PtsI) [Oleiagrimonas soli]